MKYLKIICLLYFLFSYEKSNAQRIPAPEAVSLQTRSTLEYNVNKSDVIVEGEVINETKTDGFLLDSLSTRPFTSVIIRVSRIFKGQIKDTIVELVIEGGTIPYGKFKGIAGGMVDGSFVGKGYHGIFFLRSNNTNIQSGKNIESYFLIYFNSYIVYMYNPMHWSNREAYYEGKTITDFEKYLYKPIEAITGTPAKVIGLNSFEAAAAKKQQR